MKRLTIKMNDLSSMGRVLRSKMTVFEKQDELTIKEGRSFADRVARGRSTRSDRVTNASLRCESLGEHG